MSKLQNRKELLEVAKPILFDSGMTKAILDGLRVQTRRFIEVNSMYWDSPVLLEPDCCVKFHYAAGGCQNHASIPHFENSEYKVGDILWVREPVRISEFSMWINNNIEEYDTKFLYLADNKFSQLVIPKIKGSAKKWLTHCQGIPNGCIREMARIFLKVTNVRVERLQDISKKDIQKEGTKIDASLLNKTENQATLFSNLLENFITNWDNAAPKNYKWEDNPYIFVYEFEMVKKELLNV